MIAVIFEVMPHPERKSDYLDMVAIMRPLVDRIAGFISGERFHRLTNPDKLLLLSFFRDEAAIGDWRRLTKHRAAQSAGRGGMFDDYRLRIARVFRDYGLFDRDEAPANMLAHHR